MHRVAASYRRLVTLSTLVGLAGRAPKQFSLNRQQVWHSSVASKSQSMSWDPVATPYPPARRDDSITRSYQSKQNGSVCAQSGYLLS